MIRASEAERRRLQDDFVALCAAASPSGSERACAELVAAELGRLGFAVLEDAAGTLTGGNCGNLFARVPGRANGAVLICTHLDTVPPAVPIEPVLLDGWWENAGPGILGADNKAAVAVALALARRLAAEPGPLTVELLFTVGEEDGLSGVKAFDTGHLLSTFGYTFDHASPIGEIVTASPTYYRLGAELGGLAAHAGIRPEVGRSAVVAAARAVAAMRLGRLDEETTANIGIFEGGSSANVVPGHCRIVGEARSIDSAKAERAVTAMVERLGDAANTPDCECDLDVSVERVFDGYRTAPTARQIRVAELALGDCGYQPRTITTGGGSDANVLLARGFACANLANGTERNHQPDERVSVAALGGMLDVALALVRRAGEAIHANRHGTGRR